MKIVKPKEIEIDKLIRGDKNVITYKGKKVSDSTPEGAFVYEGYNCQITGQNAKGHIDYIKVSKVED